MNTASTASRQIELGFNRFIAIQFPDNSKRPGIDKEMTGAAVSAEDLNLQLMTGCRSIRLTGRIPGNYHRKCNNRAVSKKFVHEIRVNFEFLMNLRSEFFWGRF
jgi:hypothetical protein